MERAAAGPQRALDVDPRQRALGHRELGGATQLRENVAEVGVVAHHDWPDGIAGVAQQGLERLDVERAGQPVIERDRDPQVPCDDLRRLGRPELWRADDRVGLEPDAGQERPEPLGLLLALVGQRSCGVVAGPGLGIPSVGVAQEVELDQGLRSSTSPVTR